MIWNAHKRNKNWFSRDFPCNKIKKWNPNTIDLPFAYFQEYIAVNSFRCLFHLHTPCSIDSILKEKDKICKPKAWQVLWNVLCIYFSGKRCIQYTQHPVLWWQAETITVCHSMLKFLQLMSTINSTRHTETKCANCDKWNIFNQRRFVS